VKLKKLAITTLIIMVPSLATAIHFTQKNQVGDRVVQIIDGDTFKLQNKQTIRLSSLDAPALDKCMGEESKKALSKLVLRKRVILLEPYADRYGRIIALVISDGRIINEIMIRNGYAVDTGDNSAAKKALRDANDYARENKLGIFNSKCSQTVPLNPDCVIKGNHNQRQDRPLYSYPGCANYNRTIIDVWKDDEWFCSETEALKAGYTKSGDCNTDYPYLPQ